MYVGFLEYMGYVLLFFADPIYSEGHGDAKLVSLYRME